MSRTFFERVACKQILMGLFRLQDLQGMFDLSKRKYNDHL
jgi:hypothetical protein